MLETLSQDSAVIFHTKEAAVLQVFIFYFTLKEVLTIVKSYHKVFIMNYIMIIDVSNFNSSIEEFIISYELLVVCS